MPELHKEVRCAAGINENMQFIYLVRDKRLAAALTLKFKRIT